jgi:excisionase family DNA binding protein
VLEHPEAWPRPIREVTTMSAYATARSGGTSPSISPVSSAFGSSESSILEAVIEDLAERVAAAVVSRLSASADQESPEWLDSRRTAEYLGVHRDTLRKLAAERTIPTHQDGPGCKLFFRRSDLDDWRRSGGRVVQLSSVIADAA